MNSVSHASADGTQHDTLDMVAAVLGKSNVQSLTFVIALSQIFSTVDDSMQTWSSLIDAGPVTLGVLGSFSRRMPSLQSVTFHGLADSGEARKGGMVCMAQPGGRSIGMRYGLDGGIAKLEAAYAVGPHISPRSLSTQGGAGGGGPGGCPQS